MRQRRCDLAPGPGLPRRIGLRSVSIVSAIACRRVGALLKGRIPYRVPQRIHCKHYSLPTRRCSFEGWDLHLRCGFPSPSIRTQFSDSTFRRGASPPWEGFFLYRALSCLSYRIGYRRLWFDVGPPLVGLRSRGLELAQYFA